MPFRSIAHEAAQQKLEHTRGYVSVLGLRIVFHHLYSFYIFPTFHYIN